MEPILRITAGQAAGTDIPLAGTLTIGRSATGSGSLGGDPEISREHARITSGAGGELVIEDLGSTNGTFVNGQRIAAATTLRAGDRLRLGASQGEIVAPQPAVGGTAVRQRPVGEVAAAAPAPAAAPDPQSTSLRSSPVGEFAQAGGVSRVLLRLSKQPGALPDQGADWIEEDDPVGRHPQIIAIATIIAGILIGGMIAAAIFGA